MSPSGSERDVGFYAETYDASVPDWPGELDFYREMAEEAKSKGAAVLEIACGTGRVAIRLAQQGVAVVGLDLSPDMLAVARQKGMGLVNIRWIQADMRSFDLGERFGLVIIPGHAFHNLTTPQDQVACLECIKRHLNSTGILVIHLDHPDMGWLGDLVREKGGVFEAAEQFCHPETGRQIRASRAWSYERVSQTAISQTLWEEVDEKGQVLDRWQTSAVRLHCLFRFEVEHLLGRVGYVVQAVYGDFGRHALEDNSSEMIWLARCGQPNV
jgi:ubiquinone/menaquinone biosynthesis C-methylase UbiE